MGHFHLQHHVQGVDASEMMRVQDKKRETNGVKRKYEKRLSEAWGLRLGRWKHINCLLDGRDGGFVDALKEVTLHFEFSYFGV